MSDFKPDFFLVPSILVPHEKLRLIDGYVYACIYWMVRLKNEKCYASNDTIGKMVGVEGRTVRGCLERLEKAGFVRRVFVAGKEKSRAEIIPLVVMGTSEQMSLGVGTNEPRGVGPNEPQIKNKETENNKGDIDALFSLWLSLGLVQHRKLTSGMQRAMKKALKDYDLEEVRDALRLYAKVLEKGVDEKDRKYFWSYEWGLEEFMQRGLKKFAGAKETNFRKKSFEAPAKREMKVDSFA